MNNSLRIPIMLARWKYGGESESFFDRLRRRRRDCMKKFTLAYMSARSDDQPVIYGL